MSFLSFLSWSLSYLANVPEAGVALPTYRFSLRFAGVLVCEVSGPAPRRLLCAWPGGPLPFQLKASVLPQGNGVAAEQTEVRAGGKEVQLWEDENTGRVNETELFSKEGRLCGHRQWDLAWCRRVLGGPRGCVRRGWDQEKGSPCSDLQFLCVSDS